MAHKIITWLIVMIVIIIAALIGNEVSKCASTTKEAEK